MEQENFQRQILSQISLTDLVNALLQYEQHRHSALKKETYILGSAILGQVSEAGLLPLIKKLLEKVKIPPELLDIVRYYIVTGTAISTKTWDYFYNYTFTGSIETSFKLKNNVMHPTAKPIVAIKAENAIIDILSSPLNMLVGRVEDFALLWKQLADMGASTYYLPKHNSELFIYIEGHVANYYGAQHAFEAGVTPPTSNIFHGYRFIGLIDQYPFSDKLIDAAKQVAIAQAASTTN